MTYSLPIRTGKHTLILKFAEVRPSTIVDVFRKAWPKSLQY